MTPGAPKSHLPPAAVVAVLAASSALAPVFTSGQWFAPVLLGTLVAFGLGAAARRLDVPGTLAPALSALGLVVLVGLLFHPGTTLFGVPTSETLDALGVDLRSASRDINVLAAPVDPTVGLRVLATIGVYFVAMVVDLLVFRGRRPAAAGIPLLTLYLVPASLAPKGTTLVPFVLAAAGYVWLLVAEGRDQARGWGRRLVGIGIVEDLVDLSPVARVGRRLGAAAVGVAVVVPVFLPSFGSGLLQGGGGLFGPGDGPSSTTVVNPIVNLQAQLRSNERTELLRVRTDRPEYLRLTALDRFDGTIWSPSPQTADKENRVGKGDQVVPLPDDVDPGVPMTEIEYRIEVDGLAVRWLPVPYLPRTVELENSKWLYDERSYSIFSSRTTSEGVSFTARSALLQPSREMLDVGFNAWTNDDLSPYLAVPGGEPPPIALQVLDQVTRGKRTPFAKAVALQEFFLSTGGFTYSLDVERGNDTDHLTAFLVRRTGYCEQFAATMAYLSRLAGIPARVAIGFTAGTRQSDGSYVVTNQDAHAWPELWFPRFGWLRFEPTPRGGVTSAPSYTNAPGPVSPQPSQSPGTNQPSATPGPSSSPSRRPPTDTETTPGGTAGGSGGSRIPGWVLLVAALGLVVAGGPAALTAALRSRRWRRALDDSARAHAAWDEVADAAEDTGHTLRVSESPRAAAARLLATAGLDQDAAGALAVLAGVEERARYARRAPAEADLRVRAATVRVALHRRLGWRRRLRATLFPASTLRRARLGLVLAVDALDRRQAALWARLRRLRPARS